MIAEIGSLLTSSKAAYDIAKGIGSLKSEVDRNESISKILEVLLSVQTNALSVNAIAQELQEDKSALTQKIMEFEKWSETELQYELKEITPGIFVYCYKIADEPAKPIHWLCTKCFQERKAYIIQFDYEFMSGRHYFCPNCSTKYNIPHSSSNSSAPSFESDDPHGGIDV
jgi:hypothetical protein